jgi:hypothetical protein
VGGASSQLQGTRQRSHALCVGHTSSAPDSQARGPDAAPQGGDALLLCNAGADGEHAAVAVGAVSDVELCLHVALEATASSRRTEAPRPPRPAPGVVF